MLRYTNTIICMHDKYNDKLNYLDRGKLAMWPWTTGPSW